MAHYLGLYQDGDEEDNQLRLVLSTLLGMLVYSRSKYPLER